MSKKLMLGTMAIVAGFIIAGFAYAQEPASPAPAPAAAPAAVNELVPEWLPYAEVVSVDSANKSLQVKYLDFESDIEKQATVFVNKQTSFENVKSFDEIKPQDNVYVDYIVDAQGKNIAVSIGVEKPEDTEDVSLDQMPLPGESEPAPKIERQEPAAQPGSSETKSP